MPHLYELTRVRDAGWLLPRHRHAFSTKPVGRLLVGEEYLADLARHTLTAHLLDAVSGARLSEIPPLYDVRLLKWTSGLVVLAGFERIPDGKGLKILDVAQTWLLNEPEA